LSDATVIINRDGLIKLFNAQAEKMFGYTKSEVIDKSIEILLPERFREKHLAMRHAYLEQPVFRAMGKGLDLFALDKSGTEIPIEVGLAPIETSEGLLISAAIRDISERKETEQFLLHQANYDSLTDLPNRGLALDRLSHAIAIAKRKPRLIAVLFIDLDNFKQVNDSLGHTVGDKLLQQVSQRLRGATRANDTVARLGGDEFLIVVPELEELYEIEIISQKILTTISHPYKVDERDIFIGASIGITMFPEDGDEPEVLLRNADAAMYQSKKAGRNTFRFFTHEMNEILLARLNVEYKLRGALKNNELYLHYQPLFDIDKQKVIGAEALLRWNNPVLGPVPPDGFISIAEETGLINSIGEWVLSESCRMASLWQQYTGIPIRISVNIAATQFRSGDLVNIVSDALAASGLAAELLELEITERVLIDDNPNVYRILNDIKRMGVRLALDDFGTGYSSLGYLKRFRFDVLKIDRIFVSDITVNSETKSLCSAIVAMARSLNLDVVAEGVENEQQLNILQGLGVKLIQGFYLCPPATPEKVQNILHRRNAMIHPV
jgi:diguanylate cyclase (GGDEF)-like protein/PAS domain S-box-containing protein